VHQVSDWGSGAAAMERLHRVPRRFDRPVGAAAESN
jgi:hypothetical protein